MFHCHSILMKIKKKKNKEQNLIQPITIDTHRVVNVAVRSREHRCPVTKGVQQRCHRASQLFQQSVVPSKDRAFRRIEDIRVTTVSVAAAGNSWRLCLCRFVRDPQVYLRFLPYRSRRQRRRLQRGMILRGSRSDGDSYTIALGSRSDQSRWNFGVSSIGGGSRSKFEFLRLRLRSLRIYHGFRFLIDRLHRRFFPRIPASRHRCFSDNRRLIDRRPFV